MCISQCLGNVIITECASASAWKRHNLGMCVSQRLGTSQSWNVHQPALGHISYWRVGGLNLFCPLPGWCGDADCGAADCDSDFYYFYRQHHLLCSSLSRCLLLSPVRKRTVGDMSFETQFINPPPNLYCWPWLQTNRTHAFQQEKLQTLVWLLQSHIKPDRFFENLLMDSVILILNWILCCRDHLWICVFLAQTVQKSQSICRKLIFHFKMLGHCR